MQKKILFKVERERVLVPVGAPCPFGCRYCYTRGSDVGSARVDADEILSRFREFLATSDTPFKTIQFGYDGDPFAQPERGIAMLRQLVTTGKHVNFSTKALLTDTTLNALSNIQKQMKAIDTTLSALVSLSCWNSAHLVEPHTPSPSERMQTVARLRDLDIPVFIAVRPVMPHIADEEYERIASAGVGASCNGFVLGPLYADDRGQFVRGIPPELLAATPHRRCTVSWSAHRPVWTRYEEETRLQHLMAMIRNRGGRVFLSSADAMVWISRERIAI
jgi:DNA repair photolyase